MPNVVDFRFCTKFEKKKYISWKEIDYNTVSMVIRDIIHGLPSQPTALCLDYNAGMAKINNL